MDDVTARLDKLSPRKRVALLSLLRKKKGEAEIAETAPPPPARVERTEGPLSFAQQRLWFLDRLAPGSPLYNVPGGLRFAGRLVPAVLAACLSEVVRRHAALRTRFEIRGDMPVQIVEPAAPLPLPLIDVSALPGPVRAAEAQRIVRTDYLAPFDLGRPPLVRARLLRLGAEEHLLVYVFHHIASDAWSLEVAAREVAALYPAFLEGRPSPLPELPLQYAEYAWQQVQALQGEVLARELEYWRPRLAGAPVLELPADRPRPAVPSLRGAEMEEILRPDLEAGLRELARQERATAFMALLAPVCAFLARLAGSEDVAIGTVVAKRDGRDLKDLIGFFVNTLVLRLDLSGDPDFRQLLAQSREVVLGAFTHQALPFEKLVDELGLPRDPYRPPLLRVLFQLLPAGPASAPLPGLSLERYELPGETSKFDLVISVLERSDGLLVQWRHDQDLFDPDTIARWAGSFQVLLDAWLEDPALRASEIPLLTGEQRRQLLAAWAPEPVRDDRGRRPLPALFEEQVDRTPEAPALSVAGPDGARLTYRELDERANRLARWLVDAGVVPGDRVALRLDRSADLVVALLGVLKTGAAYVPLDPASPPERLAFALEDSGAAVVVDAALLEREAEAIARQSGERLRWNLDPELPAYLIYTSGSTGRPKGVIVPHGAVSRLFTATAPWFGFGPDDVWTLFHSYAFDFSVWEMWGALLHGGRLVVVPYWASREPEAFVRLLAEERVTVLNQTPSAFRQLIWAEARSGGDLSLRCVVFGGEALDPAMLAPWLVRHGDERPRLVNMYGITETTVHVTYRPISRQDAARPASVIGRPIPDLTLHVLDRHLQLQPAGIPGEICVGGEGLAHGYLGRADLTAARFVPDPWGPPGARLYRSGDLARRRPDGELEYLGRIDHQVKIRGFRIELGEIEAALTALPRVREAVVLVRPDGRGGEGRLAAWLTAGPEGAPPAAEMREALGRRLPDYMIPADFVVLDRLPLTANGKLDRRALPDPEAAPAAASGGPVHVPPRDALEEHVAGLFRQVLSVPAAREIGALDDFFELGGTSISGAVLVNRLQETLGEIVHVVAIFDHPTVEALAAYVRDEHPAAAARIWSVATQVEEAAAAPPGPAELAEMRRLIVEGRPEPEVRSAGEPLNPPAVFLLSPPRSGSTLLRVMLGTHPRLFAPPELELLSFQTLAGREAAFLGRDRFWLEGVTRAVVEARSCDAAEAERIVAAATAEGWTTRRFYRELQGWIGGRLLVDKTPSYALDPLILRRGEEWFAEARYIHLLRHPQATNRSFEEARLDQIFFRRPHRFARARLAELIWTVSHRNILDFLAEIPPARRWTVRFEELVRDPERVLAGVCGFLGLDFDPAMADPYRGGTARMADGLRAESRMLGDVKFHTHSRVDAAAAERWRQTGGAPLGAPARHLAVELGYDLETGRGAWEEGGTAPASFAQERLWVLDQLQPGTSTYNIPGAIRLEGSLDAAALAGAVNEIVRRHAALRTVFAAEAGQPVQRVEPWGSRPLPCADLSAVPGEARGAEVRRLAAEEALRPFDLTRGPLFRVVLLHLGPREHVALYTMHHIVSDGWSMGIFSNEVAALYEAFVLGRPSPLAELPLQYPDFALRQRGRLDEAGLSGHLEWWKEKLAGLATLELPTDHPRPPVRSGDRGAARSAVYPAALSARLFTFGRGEQATLYMALLAAFQVLLHRLSHQDDIAVGSPVANRTERDVEDLIGFFVNTLVMRNDASGDPTFREMLARVRRTTRDALLHQEAPFERVVEAVQPERQLARSPLFQVLFSLQNTPRDSVVLPGLSLERMALPAETAKFDLSLAGFELPDGLAVRLEFDLDLYEPATADRMLRHLETLIAGALDAPDARLSELPLLAPAEREQLLAAWNRTAAPFPREVPIHRLFEARADRQPDAVAVSADEREDLTYADLDAAANRLAWRLRRLGAGPEVPVLVVVERSPDLIVAVLAVLKSGGFFVPFDPAHPRERLGVIAARVGARLAVTQERSLDLLPDGVAAVCVDRDRTALAGEPSTRLEGGAVGESLMYVLFTSGSTGEPKGVAVRHRNACHLLHGNAFSAIGPGETYVVLTAVTFDPSILEVWGTLVHGGRLAVLPPQLPSLDELADFLDRHDVTQMHLTTALFHQMAERRPGRLARLHRLAVGGEALSPALAGRALEAAPGLLVTNCYGPTEITVICSTHDVAPEDARRPSMPIGRPVANTALYVLGRRMEPVPDGVWGELFIGGEGVSRGYFGRADLTADRYVPDPFGGAAGARLYRSGDMVRWRADGVLDFAGRIDRQVKIRGYRIEPGEIEAAITAHPEVSEAAVLVRGEGGQRWLVACVASAGRSHDAADAAGFAAELRSWLGGRLPDPMIPADFAVLPELPLTPNGKVDRRALTQIASLTTVTASGDRRVEPRTPTEQVLAGLWVEVLGAERTGGRVGVHDHFFALGGHSLLATRLTAAVRDAFDVDLPLRAVFEQPTLEEMARAIDTADAAATWRETGAWRQGSEEPSPLSFAQQSLWLQDRIAPGTAAYNIPGAFRLRGDLDVAALRRGVAEIVRRHDALRTTFAGTPGRPVQRIAPFDPEGPVARLPLIDLSALVSSETAEAEVLRLARGEARRPFDLAAGPLFRTVLLRIAGREHIALYTMHHIVSDGWSMDVFRREAGILYDAFAAGRPSPLPPLPLQYADFARRQRERLDGEPLERGLAAWRRRLDGVAPLELPTDRPRPRTRSWRGDIRSFALAPASVARLSDLARSEQCTLFMALLALVQTFLHRLSEQDDIAVGTAEANRTDRDIEGLIGFFVNSLVLRTDLSGAPAFREVLRRARDTTLEAFQLREIPFEKVVEAVRPARHSSRSPLFQVMLTLQNAREGLENAVQLSGLVLEPVALGTENAKFDLSLAFTERPSGLTCSAVFALDLFEPDTVARWVRQLAMLLEAAVAAPDRSIEELLPLTAEEREQLRAARQAGAPPEAGAAGHVPPRDALEKVLAGLFVEVLGVERTGGSVGVRDSFFELGGHSLLATGLLAAIQDTFQVELPLRLVFEEPTVEGLARAIAADKAVAAPAEAPLGSIGRRPGEVQRFPVSFSQLREWILDRLEPGNPAYNISSNLRIGGPLSVPVLSAALQEIVRRHEVFRTAFAAGLLDQEQPEPLQVILPELALQVPVIDLAALPDAAREEELWRRVRDQARTGFDLAAAPLLRARVVRLGPDDHALLMTVHHIISDGWSMRILNQELAVLYEAAAAGRPSPLPPLPVQYADYAVWQRGRLEGEALERQTSFWRHLLAGAPSLLELPADRPRPPVRSSRGGRIPILLPQPLAGRLDELALRHGATLFMVLLAGYQSLLARWSGQEDVVVGTYSGNRPRKELEGLIGFFINTLVLRTGLSGDPSFAEMIGRVRETTLEAYAHSDVPFEKLLEILQLPRDPSRTPLFQALLVLQNFPPTRADLSTGVRLSSMAVGGEKSDYDLALWLGEGADGVGGTLEYSADLFDETTAARFASQLRTLLEAAVADPGRNIWTLPLVGEEEGARQLAAWSRGPAVPPGPSLLHLLVEEQAARTPAAVAVEAGGVRLTYAELVERARHLAGHLRGMGVAPGSIAALAAERSPELVATMLATLQAGAAYLPLDPAYPQERREYMLADSGAVEIKDSKDFKDDKDERLPLESLPTLSSLEGAPAYLIYTSGSTGRPKGVVVPHRAISSFVRGARETYGLGPGDRVLQFASISFDTSAEEIWPALASGATLVLRPEEMAASIPHFVRELERLGITVLDLPTAFWHEMVVGLEAESLELPRALRLVILGGEEALADRFALWRRRAGSSVRLVNTYGPTEATIVATRRELSGLAPGAAVPIGRPIPGARAYVLDRFFAPVPPGVRGELWIGGAGVARGYLGRPELTAERFIPDPFSEEPGARLYRTGDLAVLRPDGDLVFAGRADRQLKIRGYRIEPGEVEAALRLHPALRDAVVDARGPGDDRRLIAWIVPQEGAEAPGAADLRAFLRGILPDPLVPAAFAVLAGLPYTPGGKVDRRALSEPVDARSDTAAWAEPQSALERAIAGIYGDLLRVARVGLHDNFFDLGGHSLLIVRAHQKLKEALGREIPVVDLFRFPTVASLARHLGGEETGHLQKVQGLAEQQRAAQQRQRAAMERLRSRGGRRRHD